MSHSHSSYRGEPGAFQPQGHVEQPCPKASERNGALRHIYVSANGWWNCGLCQYAPAPAAPAPRCICHTGPWSGTPDPQRPDTHWLCDQCGRSIEWPEQPYQLTALRMIAAGDDKGLVVENVARWAAERIAQLTADLARANEDRAAAYENVLGYIARAALRDTEGGA